MNSTPEPGAAADIPPRIAKPDARFLRAHPAHMLALGFGSGLSPIMPGTMGTLLAWLSFATLSRNYPDIFTTNAWVLFISLGFLVGIWACARTGRDIGSPDHGSMVWDEIIAFWLVLLLVMPASLGEQFAAFLLFRLFDMAKPPPIRYFDRRIKGGFGVMWDDLVAAFYTLLALAIWHTIMA